MTGPTHAELFAGYGGLSLAVEEFFDAELKWYAEFDPAPSKIMEHHWPGVPNYGDVTKINWRVLPRVDILSGGSPCQDVSAAGRRGGMVEGMRSNLWIAMRDAIAEIRPTYVVWENVRGALSAKATSASDVETGEGSVGEERRNLRALGRVLGDLASLGYDAQWRVVRASAVGAPHRRERVFVLARNRAAPADSRGERDRGRNGSPGEVSKGGPEHPSFFSGSPLGSSGATEGVKLLPTVTATEASGGIGHATQGGKNLRTTVHDEILSPGELDLLGELPPEAVDFGPYEPSIKRWEEVTGNPAPAPTELSPRGRHRLSEHFTEWVMGVPAGWICNVPGISRADKIKAAGNGVVPQQAFAALREMYDLGELFWGA